MVQEHPTPRFLSPRKMRPPFGEVRRGPACFALVTGPRGRRRRGCGPIPPLNRGARLTSGGRKQRLCPLIYGARTSDAARLERFKDASSQGGGQTRPGVLTHLIPGQGALLEMTGAIHNAHQRAASDLGGTKHRLCPLIYGARTSDAPRLEPFKVASSQAGGRTRPGVLRTWFRAKGCWWKGSGA